MSKQLDSFPVRASRRWYENTGKVCPSCGQADPLLLGKDGRCANCASRNTEEKHHILPKALRRTKDDEQIVISISPIAHDLVSALQAGHAVPPVDDPDSDSFLEALCREMIASLAELWWVLTYLGEQPEVVKDIPLVMSFPLVFLILLKRPDLIMAFLLGGLFLLLLMAKPGHLDLSKVHAYAKEDR